MARRLMTWLTAAHLVFRAAGCIESIPQPAPGGGAEEHVPAGADATDLVDTAGSAADSHATPDIGPGCEMLPGMTCCPGEPNGCSDDMYSILRCRDDGTGWEPEACTGEGTGKSLCLTSDESPHGYCTNCAPGERTCQDDQIVQICEEEGLGWVEFSDCDGEVTGMACMQGKCESLCGDEYGPLHPANLTGDTGCHFWAVRLRNELHPLADPALSDGASVWFGVAIVNVHPEWPVSISVSGAEGELPVDCAGTPIGDAPIPAGSHRLVDLSCLDDPGADDDPVYEIRSSIPVAAYQLSSLVGSTTYSADVSLLLNQWVLGKHHLVLGREQAHDLLGSQVVVAATGGGDTQVAVDVTAPATAKIHPGAEETFDDLQPGDTLSVTLAQGEVLSIQTHDIGADLTGSRILSNRDVAVFSGSAGANAPNSAACDVEGGVCAWDGETPCDDMSDCTGTLTTCCADHLEQQLPPVHSWGLNYLAAKAATRNKEEDVYRIVAADDGTQVTLIPPSLELPMLDSGEWVEFESTQDFEIAATKPVLVGQFLAGRDAPEPNVGGFEQPGQDAGTGDPSFILLVPVEQFREEYSFMVPEGYESNHVTVLAPLRDDGTVSPAWLDCPGTEPAGDDPDCAPLSADAFDALGSGQFAAARLEVEEGVHHLRAEEPVMVYVYGYAAYTSYGCPAGMEVRDLGYTE